MAIDFASHADDGEHPELSEAPTTSQINITPLIDVLLVLLVMLIITIPVNFHAVRIELPQSSPAPDGPPPPVVKLEISATQQIHWNGEALAGPTDLQDRLISAARLPFPPEIHIHAAATTPYESVAAVLSSAQTLGLQKIGIVGLDEYAAP
jgi:biopolymer transport protein ExbD